MDPLSSHNHIQKKMLMAEDWRTNLYAVRDQLKQAQKRLERYRAALRLANVEIERRNRGIIALTTFAYQASRTADPANLLRLALVQALDMTGAPTGATVLINTETKTLNLGIHKGLTPTLAKILTGQDLEHGAAALMPHLVAGSGALLEYITSDDEPERELLRSAQLTSLVSLPLQLGPKLMGAFLVGSQENRPFTPAELYFLMALTQEVAVGLESIYLREGIWYTAELFLGGGSLDLDQQTLDETALDADNIPTPFELPPTDSTQPRADVNDLEQLLAAMMEAEDEVQQQNADLQTLNSISEMMNRTLKLKELLHCAVEQAKNTLGTDAAWLYLLNQQGDRLVLRAHIGLSKSYILAMRHLNLHDGIEGLVVTDNKPYFIQSIRQDDLPHKIWVDKEGIHAIAAVPITRPDQEPSAKSYVIGVLVAATITQGAHAWTPRQIRLISSIANQVALAVDNARLYEKLQEAETNLRAGNTVLQNLNDMLLEKITFLEGFIQDELVPALTKALPILQNLFLENPYALNDVQKQDVVRLQEIIDRLNIRAQETWEVNTLLGSQLAQIIAGGSEAKEPHANDLPGSVRSEKKSQPVEHPSQPADEASPGSPQETTPPQKETPDSSPGPPVKQEPMSFADAVAAGLVPPDLLNREKKQRKS